MILVIPLFSGISWTVSVVPNGRFTEKMWKPPKLWVPQAHLTTFFSKFIVIDITIPSENNSAHNHNLNKYSGLTSDLISSI